MKCTERPEAVEVGTVILVGTDKIIIKTQVIRTEKYKTMTL